MMRKLAIAVSSCVAVCLASATVQAAEWAAWVSYHVGDVVTYQGPSYQCRQAHTSQPGWEPPNAAALWLRVDGATATATVRPTARPTPRRSTPTATYTRTSTATATRSATATPTY